MKVYIAGLINGVVYAASGKEHQESLVERAIEFVPFNFKTC